jgi:prepilin-type N-terminal cleavage/methylation domain-containing protein
MYRRTTKGFTLIELLVVIAIIGVLSSVVLASLNSARANGRNAARVTLVNQYITALELSFDINRRYPVSNTTYVCLGDYPGTTCWGGSYAENSTVLNELRPYIAQLAVPPGEGLPYSGLVYTSCPGTYCPSTQSYQIHYFLEGVNKSCVRGMQADPNWNSTGTTYCQLII